MRFGLLVTAVLVFTSCSHSPPPAPAVDAAAATEPPEPPFPGIVRLRFKSLTETKKAGNVNQTLYAEKPGDAQILDTKFDKGVLIYRGQLGFGLGSAWAGFGFGVNFTSDASPLDISQGKTITVHLASPTTRALRIRIIGPDREVQNAGCYPIMFQPVTKELTAYSIPLDRFAPEGWCGPKARTIQQTAPQAMGIEIVDTAYQRAPSTFSVGEITVP